MTKTETKKIEKRTKFTGAVGRRKTSTASVRITPAKENAIIVNGKEYTVYFPTEEMKALLNEPFVKAKIQQKFAVSVVAKGGGIHSQAEAVRHGISRALIGYDSELRKRLKKEGLLKRDPRAKERRKFGLKKARKSAQWSKR
jgi:small subunit ribosomal protein S9